MAGLINQFFVTKPRLRRLVTRLLEGDRDLTVRLLGADIRVNSVKEHGYVRASRFMARNSFAGEEAPVLASLIYLLRDADAFVDVGSNVGVYCAVLGRFRRFRKIPFYAFEPNPDTYKRLLETTAGPGVETFNCALSDREGELDFVSGAVSHIFATVDNRSDYTLRSPTVRIPCRRLDSIPIKGERILMKIDVEGHEWPVLKGASGLFDGNRVMACFVDGFKEEAVPAYFREKGFRLLDGRSLEERPAGDCYALLAVKGY
ncbi:MAG TPA: FkbM family methyltransferase [Candidatus Sulfotelmatobacter sp.]|nr:FkbM family methyltransferase [Candidatus Sulfotelmatobacter sp.]